jgi:hypothetical protein
MMVNNDVVGYSADLVYLSRSRGIWFLMKCDFATEMARLLQRAWLGTIR